MSNFEERPKFYQSKEKAEKLGFARGYSIDKSDNDFKHRHGNLRMLVDLLRLIPNYSDQNNFRNRKKMIKNLRRGIRW